MPTRTVVISVLAAVVVLVAVGVVLARSGGDGSAAVPKGYATYEARIDGHTVRFAYPRAWGDVERRTERGVQIFRIRGPRDDDRERSAIRLAAEPDTNISFQSQYGLVDAHDRLQLANDRELSEEDVDVPGAEHAKRLVLEYDLRTDAGGTQRSRLSSVSAQTDDGLFVTLLADTAADDPDVDADAVLESLSLDG